ncbi:unnamed protein product, partial [Symbiodinium necroappetens]
LKAEGILSLGAILKKSRTLVVVWDPSYLSRLWCVFELAAFLHAHREDAQTGLVIKPTVLVPMTFLMVMTTAIILLFETCLPDTDEVAFLRILLFVLSQFPNIWLIQRLWRIVMEAENQFGTFSFQKVTCYCCSSNHQDLRGNTIPCDKEPWPWLALSSRFGCSLREKRLRLRLVLHAFTQGDSRRLHR